jgi:hypothetical protein
MMVAETSESVRVVAVPMRPTDATMTLYNVRRSAEKRGLKNVHYAKAHDDHEHDLLSEWELELPDLLGWQEVDDNVKDGVGDGESVVHALEVHALASHEQSLVPGCGNGLTLEERNQDSDDKPEHTKSTDDVDGVAERCESEDTAIQHENGDLGHGNGEGVENKGGEENLIM